MPTHSRLTSLRRRLSGIAWSVRERRAGRPRSPLAAYEAGLLDVAWRGLCDLPPRVWAHHAMTAYVHSGLAHDPDKVLDDLRKLADDRSLRLRPSAWYAALGPVYALGKSDLARALFTRLDAEVDQGGSVTGRIRHARDWMRSWIDLAPTSPSAPAVEPGTVSVAVLAYGHPGRRRASANIGDHIQSLASLGHLARRCDVTFTGDDDLAEVMTELQQRVPERLRAEGDKTTVALVTADRDASTYAEIPPSTWTLAFGWYMHALFDTRYGFPLHTNLHPIFVSFHCSKRGLLTPEAAEYLRRYGPIGCRDWTTVDILLSMGVPAFFSGCLTTTVSTVFPEPAERPGPEAPTAYVDVPADRVPAGAVTYRHSYDAIRTRPFVRNLRDATTLLEAYRSRHRALVTTRLHAYLPARSLGLDVDFVPPNLSDPRFAGLAGIDDEEFEEIRTGMIGLLDPMFTAILSGAKPDEVYALWRTLTTERVLQAERRRLAPQEIGVWSEPAPSVVKVTTLDAEASPNETPDAAPAGDVVVTVGEGRGAQTTVQSRGLLASLEQHARRPVRVTFVGAGASEVDLEVLRPLTSAQLSLRAVATDGRPVEDVLALGDLLLDVDRAVLLPAGAVLRQDPGALLDLDLGGHLFAAPTALAKGRTSGFGVIESAARRLKSDTRRSTELRRVAFQAHAFDFDAFEVDVLVLDLDAMRTTGFATTALERAGTFRLRLREVLHLYAGLDHGVVPQEWAVDATVQPTEGAALTYGG